MSVTASQLQAAMDEYLAGYPALGISDETRNALIHSLPAERGTEPFVHFLHIHTSAGR